VFEPWRNDRRGDERAYDDTGGPVPLGSEVQPEIQDENVINFVTLFILGNMSMS
jgi:hypothetical protein